MCRLVAYLGEQVVLDEVLFQPDSSIVEQAVHPQLLSAMNLAGFGVVAWDDESPSADLPWTYRTAGLPFFDRNLRALSRKARATATAGPRPRRAAQRPRGGQRAERAPVPLRGHPDRPRDERRPRPLLRDADRRGRSGRPRAREARRGDDRQRMALRPDPEPPGATRTPRPPTPRSSPGRSRRRCARCARCASAAASSASPRSTS